MDPQQIRSFVERDRASVEEEKRAFWARRYRDLGPGATLRAGQQLYDHAKACRPDWPTEIDRGHDLTAHVELKRLLDSVPVDVTAR